MLRAPGGLSVSGDTFLCTGRGRRVADFGDVDYQGIIKHKFAEPHLGGRRIVTGKQRGQTGDLGGQKVLPDRPENTTPVKNGLIRHPDEEMEQESSHKDMNDNGWIL